jgi:hypothetical protein
VAPSECTDQGEGSVGSDVLRSHDQPFGLFDDDSAVEGMLKLVGQRLLPQEGALLQEADRGDVGQGLNDWHVGVVEVGADGRTEDVECSDDFLAYP